MKILIAYDETDGSRAAVTDLRLAGLPAGTQAVILTVADVWPGLPPGEPVPGPILSSAAALATLERGRVRAEQALAGAAACARDAAERVRAAFPDWAVTAEAVAGSPAEEILAAATRTGADLIVIGSHGRSALSRAVFGSTCQAVLRHAACSVRVGRRAADAERPVRLLIGYDGSEGAAAAVAAVAGRRWPSDSAARLVTALDLRAALAAWTGGPVDVAWAAGGIGVEPADDVRQAERTLHSVARDLRPAGLDVSVEVSQEPPRAAILSAARAWDADCIFLGAQGHGRLERLLLGSVSASVAGRAEASVEVVRGASRPAPKNGVTAR